MSSYTSGKGGRSVGGSSYRGSELLWRGGKASVNNGTGRAGDNPDGGKGGANGYEKPAGTNDSQTPQQACWWPRITW